MNHSFHCHFCKSFQWYRNWHNHPHHQHTHWSMLVILALSIFSFISGSIGDFYFEENYARAQTSATLGISGDRFTVNGSPVFLLMISYFDAMSASNAVLDEDFSRLRSLGFDGVRILPNWFINPANQLIDASGNIRPGMIARLTNIIDKAQRNNLIVDVTFCRECVSGLSVAGYQNGIVAAAQGLIPYRNLYFDVQNEADHPNNDRITAIEAGQIKNAIKAVDSQRIVSVSLISSSTNEVSYVINNGMDFHPTHGPLSTLSGIRSFVAGEKSAVPGRPVHLQEPDRCRSNPCGYTASQFTTAGGDAKCAGAAGFNFHTSAGYNLAIGKMFDQWLDPNVENTVANSLFNLTSGISWGSCSSSNPPPPPPGGPPFGSRGSCPVGFILYSDANASTADPAATSGYFCDDDPVIATQVTYPVSGTLYRSGNPGTAFTTTTGGCNFREGIRPGWSFDSSGQPIGVNLIATTTNQVSVIIPEPVSVGAWTTSPSTAGYVCIRGTEIVSPTPTPIPTIGPPPRYLYYINPSIGRIGTTVVLSGYNLTPNVKLKDSSGNITAIQGIIDSASQEVTFTVPSGLNPGNYTIKVVSDPDSDEVPFEILPGVAEPTVTGLEAPIIYSISPLTVTHGQEVEVTGEFLWPYVNLTDIYGEVYEVIGLLSEDAKVVTFTVINSIPAGVYNLSILSGNNSGTTTSFDVLTIEEGQPPLEPQAPEPPTPAATEFQDLIGKVFDYSLIFVGIAVFLMILWGGILWLTSAANPGNISTAKRYITNALLGAVLLASAYVILYTINPELVGGELTLEKLKPPPVPPPVQPPPITGPNLSQAAAQRLMNTAGVIFSDIKPDCGNPFHAKQNIQDVANGLYPAVCNRTCPTPPCIAGGLSGTINLDPFMLDSLIGLRQQGVTLTVTSFSTGKHKTVNSYHYSGRATDIILNSNDSAKWIQAVDFLVRRGFNAFCESTDGTRDSFCNLDVTDHIHLQK